VGREPTILKPPLMGALQIGLPVGEHWAAKLPQQSDAPPTVAFSTEPPTTSIAPVLSTDSRRGNTVSVDGISLVQTNNHSTSQRQLRPSHRLQLRRIAASVIAASKSM
jgi:hypothetical protein